MIIVGVIFLTFLPVSSKDESNPEKFNFRLIIFGLVFFNSWFAHLVWMLPIRFINDELYQNYINIFNSTNYGLLTSILIQSWFYWGTYKALIIMHNTTDEDTSFSLKTIFLTPLLPLININAPTPHFRKKT
jgi:hypothetical protein